MYLVRQWPYFSGSLVHLLVLVQLSIKRITVIGLQMQASKSRWCKLRKYEKTFSFQLSQSFADLSLHHSTCQSIASLVMCMYVLLYTCVHEQLCPSTVI